MLRQKWVETAYCTQRVPLAAVMVDDVEQLPGVGGDSAVPSLLGAKDFCMIDRL